MVEMTSWGRLAHPEHSVIPLVDPANVTAAMALARDVPCHGLAYGMGRSYGDSCLNPGGVLWTSRGMDRLIAFDPSQGILRCDAGVLLRDIQAAMIPQGWSLPVTPGTQMVTVGGAIANDVHGKNHHVCGSFGDHVESFHLVRSDGQEMDCGPSHHAEWFAATLGGLGLTGVITEATLRLKPVPGPWLEAETIPYTSLDTFFQLSDESEGGWEHTVSWIDCLSQGDTRGIFMRANPVEVDGYQPPRSSPRTMPLVPPMSMVNRLTLRPFNAAYYALQKRKKAREIVHYKPYFYPLDNVLEWNRMYGPRGFYQYQMVVPRAQGRDTVAAMLGAIAASGEGSFLAVLKTFGNRESCGLLSFPQPGVTLALDFPNNGSRTHALFARLDAILREAKGRIYPAKDARMPRDLFEASYPNLPKFLKFRDPGISSAMSRRLIGS
jgi:FAD/FMN-containing dehydrogenase